MLSNRAMGNGFIALGGVLLLIALATVAIGPSFVRDRCRRYCWLYDLLTHVIGSTSATVLTGLV
jgi:hypothetical protein